MRTQKEIAITILEQLGGAKFRAMTGAKNFSAMEGHEGKPARVIGGFPCRAESARIGGLAFQLPRNPGKVGFVRITLSPSDTYEMTFGNIRKFEEKIIFEISGVYADQLREIFESKTGFLTSLGTMRG